MYNLSKTHKQDEPPLKDHASHYGDSSGFAFLVIIRHLLQLERCSNPLRIQQDV